MHKCPNDPKNRGAQDRARINLSDEHEVQYWMKTLGVTKEELTAVVYRVGNSVEAVRRELRKWSAWEYTYGLRWTKQPSTETRASAGASGAPFLAGIEAIMIVLGVVLYGTSKVSDVANNTTLPPRTTGEGAVR
jgi:hypothetical protein